MHETAYVNKRYERRKLNFLARDEARQTRDELREVEQKVNRYAGSCNDVGRREYAYALSKRETLRKALGLN